MGEIITYSVITVVVLLAVIRQVNQYQRGVKFTFGKYSGMMKPGWRIVWPIIQSYKKVDIRVRTLDVPNQETVTKDNISVTVNAVIYYKVIDAAKTILEVEQYNFAISQLAQTTMRNVIGGTDLDSLLSNREQISHQIQAIVDQATDPWGIKVNSVELKDIVFPESMKRTMAKQAEAERERRAVIIKAEGEVQAAANLAKAANILSAANGALHLRTLQSINDVSSDQSNTIIFAMPLEILRAFESVNKMSGPKQPSPQN